MILIDFNQIAIGSVMVSLHRGEELSENLVRHLILNQIRFYRSKFVEEYGEIVICCDSKHYWRRDYFPNYKIHRKKDREATGHDWDVIFTCLNTIRDELKEVFPYKVVEVYGAEADDIIATLTRFVSNEIISALIEPQEKMLILSSDKDFIQLHSDTVDQFSPVTKKIVNGKDPVKYLKEHILKGDRSDGVPNVLSSDETFVENIRQKPLRKTTIVTIMEAMKEYEPELLYHLAKCPEDTWRRNYRRNLTLIDLSQIPETITREINKEYKEAKVGERNQLLNYFIDKRLTQLIDNVGDF